MQVQSTKMRRQWWYKNVSVWFLMCVESLRVIPRFHLCIHAMQNSFYRFNVENKEWNIKKEKLKKKKQKQKRTQQKCMKTKKSKNERISWKICTYILCELLFQSLSKFTLLFLLFCCVLSLWHILASYTLCLFVF